MFLKIKEVEERVGLSRSNIRFYEREGLLLIDRDNENNYREYSDEDVERIIKIKNLRMLGVPTADIRRLFANEIEFDTVIADCLERIKEQEKELKEIHKVCENMMQKQLNIHTWDGQIETDSKGVWKARLDEIFAQDTIYNPIEQKMMNRNITFMLLFGYALNIIFTTVLWPIFEKYQGFAGNGVPGRYNNVGHLSDGLYNYSLHWNYLYFTICACVLIMIATKIIIFTCDNVKLHFLVFIVNCLIVTNVLLCVIQWYEDKLIMWNHLDVLKYDLFTLSDMWLFWLLMMIYAVAVCCIFMKWNRLFLKQRYTIILSVVFSLAYTLIIYIKYGCFFGPFICFGVMLAYISLSWSRVNMDKGKYNRYDIFTTSNFIMNPLGGFIQF